MPGEPERCRNCDAPLGGPYCGECGQKSAELEVSVGAFLGDVLEDVVNLDSRALRTLRLLVLRPGEITARYLGGERARFVPPVRLYLFVSVGYFLLLSLLGDVNATGAPAEGGAEDPAVVAEQVREELEEGVREESLMTALTLRAGQVSRDPESFRRSLAEGASYLMFFLVPAFAGLSWLLYRRRRPYYLHHVLHALHLHVFAYLVLGAGLLLAWPGSALLRTAGGLLAVAIPLHVLVSLRRLYGQSWWVTGFKAALLCVVYGNVVLFSGVVLIVLVLLRG